MNILLRKCLLICLMLGVSLQGVAASFLPGCKHVNQHQQAEMPVALEDHSRHHMHASNSHEHLHASIAVVDVAEHGICDECNDCAVCIVPPIPVTASFLPVSAQAPTLTASSISLFLSIILEDPPRPPSGYSTSI